MPLFVFRRGDILGILLVVAVLAALIAVSVLFPAMVWQHGSRGNFGPAWDCQYMPKGEPVCIKKAPRKPAD